MKIKTAVCSVFRYSAGFVDWTRTELDGISKMWVRAYKQAWTLSGSTDSSPMMLSVEAGVASYGGVFYASGRRDNEKIG